MSLSPCRKQYRVLVVAAAAVIVPTKEEESARLIPTVDGDVLLIGNVLLCDYDEDAPEKLMEPKYYIISTNSPF
jgi:hypothetical protein